MLEGQGCWFFFRLVYTRAPCKSSAVCVNTRITPITPITKDSASLCPLHRSAGRDARIVHLSYRITALGQLRLVAADVASRKTPPAPALTSLGARCWNCGAHVGTNRVARFRLNGEQRHSVRISAYASIASGTHSWYESDSGPEGTLANKLYRSRVCKNGTRAEVTGTLRPYTPLADKVCRHLLFSFFFVSIYGSTERVYVFCEM